MDRKWKISLSIVSVAVLGLFTIGYSAFNGTFWGRRAAEKQIMNAVHKEYGKEKFHQVGHAYYHFEYGMYQVNIVFDRLPKFSYSFAMQNGKLVVENTDGTINGENAPVPPLVLSDFPNTKILGTIDDLWVGNYDRWYIITPYKAIKVGTKYSSVRGIFDSYYRAVWSDILPKGAIIYEIPNVSPEQEVAVLWKGQYVEAVRVKQYAR